MEDDTKVCPVCGETIKAAALKCRFCNTDLASFAATKEAETEHQLFAGHPAMIYSAGQLVPFVVVLAAAVAIGYYVDSWQDRLYVFAGFLVVSAFLAMRLYSQSRGIYYTITTQRIMVRRGMLSQRQENLELFRIDHFELLKPLGMRIMGQEELRLYSSDAELQAFYIYAIPNLEKLADTLRGMPVTRANAARADDVCEGMSRKTRD
jgi:membrane protein YdbS with pleckstrin-like domain